MRVTDAVTLVKRMTYRGVGEEWSNTYHLTGTTPTTPATWRALIDAIAGSEKGCYMSFSKVVRGYGYKSGQDVAEYVVDYTGIGAEISGTLAQASGDLYWAGDQAGMMRALRDTRTADGKPVYLRKYFHSGLSIGATPDAATPNTKNAYSAHGIFMLGGTLPGGMEWCAPTGVGASTATANNWVTTRTLKRRSKRPIPLP